MHPVPGPVLAAVAVLALARVITPVQGKASILGLVAESATFDDFERVLGPAQIAGCGGSHGDGCGRWACWVGPDGTTLAAGADDMEGDEDVVKHVHLLARRELADFDGDFEGPGRSAPPRCASSGKVTRSLETGTGVRLGMSRNDVLEKLRYEAVGTEAAMARAARAAFIRIPDSDREDRDAKGCLIGVPVMELALDVERGRVAGIRMSYTSVL